MEFEIDVNATKELLDSERNVLLLDCRTAEEYGIAKIDGSTFIPMDELQKRVDELGGDRDLHIVVHCHHGGRSAMVTEWLRSLGYVNSQNMAGGIDAWAVHVDPIVPRY